MIESKDFSNRDLRGIDASKRQLGGLIATGAALRNADFSQSDLQGANFAGANLSNAHLRRTDLRQACFLNADLEGADLSGADIRGTDFRGCSLIGSSFFDPAGGPEFKAKIDDSTVLPDEVLAPLFPMQLEYVRNALGRD